MEVSRGDGSVIRVEVAGEQRAAPVLFCHGLADSRLSAHLFGRAARELGLRVAAPDRPGTGGTDPRRLRRLVDWVEDAVLVLDALGAERAALLGISAGGPFAAACAARIPGRVRSLMLVSPLGPPGWPTLGMAPGERLSLAIARRAPAFGGWFLGRLATLARRSPRLFLRLATSELPGIDRRAIEQPGMRDAFLAGYAEAFRRGSRGLPRTCGCSPGPGVSSSGPSRCRHRSTTGMRTRRSRPGMPGSTPRRYRARSFSSTPATGTSRSSPPPGRCLRRSPDKC
jgi:pimeloyl-ACP methyl ester carboxylesterase